MQKHIGIFALLLFSLAVNSSAQGDNPYVKSFTAEAIDDKVYLNWTTGAGFTCQDIHILVSTDSLDGYEKKGTYFGVCGDASEKDYSYVLEEPIPNRLNFIRLE